MHIYLYNYKQNFAAPARGNLVARGWGGWHFLYITAAVPTHTPHRAGNTGEVDRGPVARLVSGFGLDMATGRADVFKKPPGIAGNPKHADSLAGRYCLQK